jgi:hypothetical protein
MSVVVCPLDFRGGRIQFAGFAFGPVADHGAGGPGRVHATHGLLAVREGLGDQVDHQQVQKQSHRPSGVGWLGSREEGADATVRLSKVSLACTNQLYGN